MELQVDGKKVFAATGGKSFAADQPVVIFIHGAGMDHTVWALQTRWFAWHGYSVLAIDLPGHGKSAGPALESIEEIGGWLVRLIEAAGASDVALVGHSMGSLAALAATSKCGGRVSKLALLGVGTKMPVHPDLLAATKSNDPSAWDLIVSWGFGKPAHFGANRAPGIWMQGGGRSLLAAGRDDVLGIDMAACDSYKDAVSAAGNVTCPVLVMIGERDQMTPPKAAVPLLEVLTNSQTVQIDNAGHMMMVEKPDEVLDALIAAL
jgi:pimeloyl-ACP methyl ester carboxylesterase